VNVDNIYITGMKFQNYTYLWKNVVNCVVLVVNSVVLLLIVLFLLLIVLFCC